MAESTKLGRNPFYKKRTSAVSKILDDKNHEEPTELKTPTALRARVKSMQIEVDWSQMLKRLYGRLRRSSVRNNQ